MDFTRDQLLFLLATSLLTAAAAWTFGYFSGKRTRSPAGSKPARRPVLRAALISLLAHAALGLLFSAFIVSEAVYRAVKTPERQEVEIRSDALARERLALEIRETQAKLPPVPVPRPGDQPLPLERKPMPTFTSREIPALANLPPFQNTSKTTARQLDDRFRPAKLQPSIASTPTLPITRLEEPRPTPAPDPVPEPIPPEPLTLASPEPLPAAPKTSEPEPLPLARLDLPPALPASLGGIPLELPGLPGTETTVRLEARPLARERLLLRDPEVRKKVLEELGGSPETEAAIESALRWLARNQEPDGRWKIDRFGGDKGHDMAATSLATLAFLAWGAQPDKNDEFGEVTRRALDWILQAEANNHQKPGDLRYPHKDGPHGDMYDQGMGAIALAEALAISGDERYRAPAQRALDFIVAAQNTSRNGGWRYSPGEAGDTSVFGWQIMALTSGRLAGLEVPETTFENCAKWLAHAGGGKHGGEYGYTGKDTRTAMVAEGMFSRQLLGSASQQKAHPPDSPIMQESAAYLLERLPKSGDKNEVYYWYYGALALYQHQAPPGKNGTPPSAPSSSQTSAPRATKKAAGIPTPNGGNAPAAPSPPP